MQNRRWGCGVLTTVFVAQALQIALRTFNPDANPLHHSDRGAQYASHAYQVLLDKHHIEVSMSGNPLGASNCYDNAVMESAWGALKTELDDDDRLLWPTRQ